MSPAAKGVKEFLLPFVGLNGVVGFRAVFLLVGLEEPPGIESARVGAPDSGRNVHEAGWHLDHSALGQADGPRRHAVVGRLFQDGVFHDEPRPVLDIGEAHHLLVNGVDEGAGLRKLRDVNDTVAGTLARDGRRDFVAKLITELRVGEHIAEHPEDRGDRIRRTDEDHGCLRIRDVRRAEAPFAVDGSTRFDQEAGIVVAVVAGREIVSQSRVNRLATQVRLPRGEKIQRACKELQSACFEVPKRSR